MIMMMMMMMMMTTMTVIFPTMTIFAVPSGPFVDVQFLLTPARPRPVIRASIPLLFKDNLRVFVRSVEDLGVGALCLFFGGLGLLGLGLLQSTYAFCIPFAFSKLHCNQQGPTDSTSVQNIQNAMGCEPEANGGGNDMKST